MCHATGGGRTHRVRNSISAASNSQQRSLYPIHVNRLQPFFLGKDARDLEALLEEVYVYMLGRIANKSMGQLVGDIHNPKVAVYRANGERDITAEAVMENLKKQVIESEAKALKIKIGGRMSMSSTPQDAQRSSSRWCERNSGTRWSATPIRMARMVSQRGSSSADC